MKTLIEQIKAWDRFTQFNSIPVCMPCIGRPGRIYLDINVLQYLLDYGEYTFEHYWEIEEYFQARKTKSKKELGYRL